MPESEESSRFVAGVFHAWNDAGIEFLVLRNYEYLPEATTNDIDVLISPRDLAAAQNVLLRTAASCEFRLHNRAEFATLALYFSSARSTTQVHFDLFTVLKWRSFDFLGCDEFLGNRVPWGLFFVPRLGHESATNLLATLIYTGKVKEKYKIRITDGFSKEPEIAAKVIGQTYGHELAAEIITAGQKQDWEFLERGVSGFRRSLIFRQLATPFRTAGSILKDACRLLNRFLRPPGLTVALCGPDGSGKSTLARSIVAGLSPTFSPLKGRQFHWKIPVFSGKRMANRAPTADPHGRPPRNLILSTAYFLIHWLEFFIGSHFRIRPITFRGGLVLIDRYYYDFFVDPRRYRLKIPAFFVRAGYAFIRKPDLVILLDAPAEVLKQRKDEVPLGEIERQRTAFKNLIVILPQGRVINASQSPEQVSEEVQRLILDILAKRTVRRTGKSKVKIGS